MAQEAGTHPSASSKQQLSSQDPFSVCGMNISRRILLREKRWLQTAKSHGFILDRPSHLDLNLL
jgi:hypothetical protein